MYGSYGIETCVQAIYALSEPFVESSESIQTMSDLKPAYVRFLQSIHSQFPIENSEVVVRDRDRIMQFSAAFNSSLIDDLQQEKMIGGLYDAAILEKNVELVERSLAELNRLNPELSELFQLAVHAVILCGSGQNQEGRRAHGGTSNRCIGVIWLNIHPGLSVENIIEMLIHELTHTLVFLDELIHAHFNYYTIGKEQYWALSSILKKTRPMDKVVHSIVVSMEILFTRSHVQPIQDESSLIHPVTQKLVASTRAAIESVLNHPLLGDVCQPRAIELVRTAKTQLEENFTLIGEPHARVV